jgi:hypothetical protein
VRARRPTSRLHRREEVRQPCHLLRLDAGPVGDSRIDARRFAITGEDTRYFLNGALSRDGRFDIVFAESLDRLSRDQVDTPTICRDLAFAT